MKNLIILLIYFLLFNYYEAVSQDNIYSDKLQYIITNNPVDTIKNIFIVKDFKLTNEDYVTYKKKPGTNISLSVENVIEYNNGKSIYYSFKIDKTKGCKFITYHTYGYLTLAESYSGKGKRYLYVIKDHIATNLYDHKNSLKAFFKEYTNDDLFFESKFKKPIFYDYKSIGEFISAYNVYKYPKKYSPVNYQSPRILKYGFSFNLNHGFFSFEDIENIYISAYSFSLGLNINTGFNRLLTWYVLPYYEKSKFTYNTENIILNSINLETAYTLTLFQRGESYFRIGPGFGIRALFLSNFDQFNYGQETYNNLKLNGLRINLGIHSFIDINDNCTVNILYRNSSVKINEFTTVAKNPSGIKGKIHTIGLGITYTFKHIYYQHSDKIEYKDYESF